MESTDRLDALVIGAHPDDAELFAGGTILKLSSAGKSVGILDLTRGEMGSRGTPKIRAEEAEAARKILGVEVRENLGYADGFFLNDAEHQRGIIRILRRYRPQLVLTHAEGDRHPDHGRACQLVRDACFYSGLRKIETEWEGSPQEAWRPKRLFHFLQNHYQQLPDFVVDITSHLQGKLDSLAAYGTQFYNPDRQADEPETYISSRSFWDFVKARAQTQGKMVDVDYGEGFIASMPLLVKDPLELV
jgi:bacillithiol biosynthesis deacetylase BshB1